MRRFLCTLLPVLLLELFRGQTGVFFAANEEFMIKIVGLFTRNMGE